MNLKQKKYQEQQKIMKFLKFNFKKFMISNK